MRLGLGNNLVKTAFPIGTSPSLDLAFALDRSFTTDPAAAGGALITSRRGPAAKFSRGSGATQVNAAGLIEYAPENLILRSEGMPTLWNPVDSSISPDVEVSPSGLTNADKLVENSLLASHRIEQSFTPISSTTYTASIFVKPAERNFVLLGFTGGSMATTYVSANLSAETVSTAIGTPIASSITKFANGWYRVSITLASTGVTSSFFDVRISTDGVWANRSYLGDGTSGIFLWGAQLERASTARTYYPTTSSAFYGPRFDYDPATLASKGLLIEEPRTNLVERSEAFNDAYWTKAAVIVTAPVVTADQVNSPSGVQSADRIVFPAVAGTNAYSLVFKDFSQAAGVSTAQSIYLRGLVGGEKIWIMWTPNGTTYVRKECVLTTSWQRFDLNYTSLSGLNYFQFGVDLRDASQSTQSAQTIFAWGAQLEAGAFPTSYIPTTSGTLQRSADVCSIAGTDFSSFYNQSEGTLFADASTTASSASPFAPSSLRRIVSATDGSAANRAGLLFNTSNPSPTLVVSSGGNLSTLSAAIGSSSVASLVKIAGVYKLNDFAISANGSVVSIDNLGLVGVGINRMWIGNQNEIEHLNGHIARIQYFRKRLSNAKLQTLTTP